MPHQRGAAGALGWCTGEAPPLLLDNYRVDPALFLAMAILGAVIHCQAARIGSTTLVYSRVRATGKSLIPPAYFAVHIET
jgi:hypothetical protein